MKPKDKAQWVCALRSGDFNQGKKQLYQQSSQNYCCLGVLADLHDLLDGNGRIGFNFQNLSNQSRETFGITVRQQDTLMRMNDSEGKTFSKIADWIEKNL